MGSSSAPGGRHPCGPARNPLSGLPGAVRRLGREDTLRLMVPRIRTADAGVRGGAAVERPARTIHEGLSEGEEGLQLRGQTLQSSRRQMPSGLHWVRRLH